MVASHASFHEMTLRVHRGPQVPNGSMAPLYLNSPITKTFAQLNSRPR